MKCSILFKRFQGLFITVFLLSAIPSPSFSENAPAEEDQYKVIITNIAGNADIVSAEKKAAEKAREGMILREGDVVNTGPGALVSLAMMEDGRLGTILVNENSSLTIRRIREGKAVKWDRTFFDLSLGKIDIKLKKHIEPPSTFEVKTPTGISGVRGTEYSVAVERSD